MIVKCSDVQARSNTRAATGRPTSINVLFGVKSKIILSQSSEPVHVFNFFYGTIKNPN